MTKETGYYCMWRGWMKHPLLNDKEPYTKREAWCWLIENAAWEDHVTSWQGKDITIKRGQVPVSYRKMAEAWSWTVSMVQRYIGRLKSGTMVDIANDTGFSIISICNYDDYQAGGNASDTASDTQPDTQPDTRADTNRRNKKLKKERNNTPTPQGGDDVLPMHLPKVEKPTRFEEFWKHYPRKEAKKQAMIAYTAALKNIGEHELIHAVKVMRSRFDNDDRDLAEKLKYCKYAQGWLNGERYLDYVNEEIEDDEDAIPDLKKMTPDEHAAWVLRRAGIH